MNAFKALMEERYGPDKENDDNKEPVSTDYQDSEEAPEEDISSKDKTKNDGDDDDPLVPPEVDDI